MSKVKSLNCIPLKDFIFCFICLYAFPVLGQVGSSELNFHENLVKAAINRTHQNVTYDPSYYRLTYPGGDVPVNKGVCTDVVIRSYRQMGIDLQLEVHEDMTANFQKYPSNWGLTSTDRNIDHRRVPNLMTYFARQNAKKPITAKATDYLAGDVVAWDLGNGITHIGIVVDKRSEQGAPFIVHNIGRGPQLEDILFNTLLSVIIDTGSKLKGCASGRKQLTDCLDF